MSNEAFLLQARRSGRDFTRERALPLQRLVPLLLNFRKGTNRDELDQFFETITDDPASVTPVSEAAFCRARQKLKPEALVTLNNVLLDSTNQQVVQQRWRGLRVLAVDGSTGRLPNLPAIEEYFGKPSGSGVPLARFSRLFDVLNNQILQAAASMRQCREGHLPADPLHVRLIRVELESGEVEVLITSLRDTKAYPYCAFAKLYALRWGIEENYKREKQRLEIENFSGRTPWVLLQDFHAKIFAQNLTAIFVRLAQWLADARYQHRRHGYRINFANALSKMKNNLVRLFLETSPLELSWRLLQRMADAVEAVRPGRKFPGDMKKVRVPGFQMQYRRTR